MNYVLNLQLEGAEQINSALDGLLKKVGSIGGGAGGKVDFAEWLGAGQSELSQIEGDGEKAAGSFAKGAEKKLKSFNIFDAWGKSRLKEMQDFWNDAIKVGKENLGGKQAGKFEAMELLGRQGGSIPKVSFSEMENNIAKLAMEDAKINKAKEANKPQQGTIKEYVVAGLATFFNPFIGARAFENIGRGKSGEGLLGSENYVKNFVLIKVAMEALGALTTAIKKTTQQYEEASRIYAKSLQSGLGTAFTTKRSIQAAILGVSETEVVKFGAALNYINPKIEQAAKTISDANLPLTKVSWEFKILKINMEAMFAKLAVEAAPAIYSLIDALNELVSWVNKNSKSLMSPIRAMNQQNQNEAKYKAFEDFASKYGLFMSGSHVKGKDDIGDSINLFRKGSDKPDVKALELFQREWSKKTQDREKTIPTPQSFMKQLPASSWEKMGLVVGGGANTTNDLIRKSNAYLQVIAKSVSGGMPRAGQFGFNPTVSNP